MYIADGRKFFYQWDADREMIVTDPDITELHFCNGRSECSLVCEVKNGRVCVPNILLQTAGNIRIYGFAEDHTEVAKIYKIFPRTKPEDYVYTETEVKRYETLAQEVEELKKQVEELPAGGAPHQMLVTDAEGNAQWEDRLCYETFEDVVFLQEQTFELDDSGMGGISAFAVTPMAGDTCAVTWNGTDYSCTVTVRTVYGIDCATIGNASVFGGESSDEPFAVLILPEEMAEELGGAAQMFALDGSQSVILSISGKKSIVKKLDPRFYEIKGETIFLDVMPDNSFTEILDGYPYSFYLRYINSGKNLVLRIPISPNTNPDWHVLLTLAGVNNTGIVFHGGIGYGGITVQLTIHEDGSNTLESHSDKLFLTDPNGAVWYIKVSADGTLTTSRDL